MFSKIIKSDVFLKIKGKIYGHNKKNEYFCS